MTHGFRELVFGGVLFAPPVAYAVASLVIILMLRPILQLIGFARVFSHASIAELSLHVTILGLLMMFL